MLCCGYYIVFTPALLYLCMMNVPFVLCKTLVSLFFVVRGLLSVRPLLLFVLSLHIYLAVELYTAKNVQTQYASVAKKFCYRRIFGTY